MPVKRAADRNLTDQERMCRLLAKMLDPNVSDTIKQQYAKEFGELTKGEPIASDWPKKFGLNSSHGIDRGMGYIDVQLPVQYIPAWFKGPATEAKVRFYLTMIQTQGSATPGIGPVKKK